MSPQNQIRQIVCRWYGMIGMPLRVVCRQQEIEDYENAHPEVPPHLWEFVNHRLRQALLWARSDDVDVVIREDGRFVLIQDLIFREKYDSVEEWRQACQEWITNSSEVFLVFHEENGHTPLYS